MIVNTNDFNDYSFNRAEKSDVDFLINTIIQAEKSFTTVNAMQSILKLSNVQFESLLRNILNEDIDNCELSRSSFIVLKNGKENVAGLGGWYEGEKSNIPSHIIKSNLISYFLPKDNFQFLKKSRPIANVLNIKRTMHTFQLEYGYVVPEHRKKGLIRYLTYLHMQQFLKKDVGGPLRIQAQFYGNNHFCIKIYEHLGFKMMKKVTSEYPETKHYFPSNSKVMLENNELNHL